MPGSHLKRSDLIGLGQGLGTRILQRSPRDSKMHSGLRPVGLGGGAGRVKEETIKEEAKQKDGYREAKGGVFPKRKCINRIENYRKANTVVTKTVPILMTDEIRKHSSSGVGRSEPDAVGSLYLVGKKSVQCSEYWEYAFKELGHEGKREDHGYRDKPGGEGLLF